MSVTERTYEQLLLEQPEGVWELVDGRLREKPGMAWDHGTAISYLDHVLQNHLSWHEFRVRVNHARLRRSEETVYIPDLAVIPAASGLDRRGRADRLDLFDQPLPLVVEVWSPSTGGYDVVAKLPEYQRRGDLEIWLLHPYERTLTAWRRRQGDGTSLMAVHRGGVLHPIGLPGGAVDLDVLFVM